MQEFKAVLFDFDGVIADTMEDNFLAWKKSFLNYNIEIQKQDYFPLEGMKLMQIAKIISEKYGLVLKDYSELVNKKNEYYLQNNVFSFYPGVLEMVDFLKNKGKLLAIVSASPREKLEKTVPKDFLDKFDTVISGENTINGKPHPEPYLKAMEKLNIEAEKSIVIENAPLGIKSAKSAKVYCIALATTLNKEYLQEADEIINNHEELGRLLGLVF